VLERGKNKEICQNHSKPFYLFRRHVSSNVFKTEGTEKRQNQKITSDNGGHKVRESVRHKPLE